MAGTVHSSERWAVVSGEPDFEVSDQGRVRRLTACSSHPAGYEMTLSSHAAGYHTVSLRGRPYYVHRLVVAAFIGPMGKGLVVNHKNGTKTDNRVSNLEVVTIAENNRHYRQNGLGAYKLSAEQAKEAKASRAGGVSAKALAERYGVGVSTMKRLLRGESYRDRI